MFPLLYYGCSILFLLYIIIDITWRLWKRKLSFIPSAPNVPWLGTVPYLGKSGHDFYKFRVFTNTKYNHLSVWWMGPTPLVRMGCVEYIEPLVKSQEVLTKPYKLMKEWLGDGLVLSTGTKWKKRRTELTGAFHFAILNGFMEIYEKNASNLVTKIQAITSKGKEIEVQQIFTFAMLDVICETSMGVSINALDSSNSDYATALHNVKTYHQRNVANPFLRYTATRKEYVKCINILHNFRNTVINENIASRKNLSNSAKLSEDDKNQPYRRKKKVFIDVLLDLYDQGEIDINGIREEVDTFMFGGHDTTTSSLSWTIYEIGRHPEIQEKLHEEIDSVSSKECSLSEKIRLLRYMECVIKESLRLHPPVPGFSRKLEKDMVLNDKIFPLGTIMTVDLLSLHMNPAYWDQPTVFNPGRFASDEKRNPYCYLPFSAGPRSCISQKFAMLEEKVFLYSILSNFIIKSTQSPEELKIATAIILYSENGINIEFSSRN